MSSPELPRPALHPFSPASFDKPVDLSLPFRSVVKQCVQLVADRKKCDAARLALCGITPEEHRISIVHNRLSESPYCHVKRFYGRLVGISNSILFRGDLALNRNCNLALTLLDDIHVKHSWLTEEGIKSANLHDIASILLGTQGAHSSLYIIFPHFSSGDSRPYRLSTPQFCHAWDRVISHAIDELTGDCGVSHMLADELPRFARLIQSFAEEDDELDWFHDFAFVHVTRSTSPHHYFDDDGRAQALTAYLETHNLRFGDIVDDERAGGKWYGQTGLIITHQAKSLAWETSSHRVAAEKLFGINCADSPYRQMPLSHLTDVSCAQIWCHDATKHDSLHPTHIELTVDEGDVCTTDEYGKPIQRLSAVDIIRKPSNLPTLLWRFYQEYSAKSKKISAVVKVTTRIEGCLEILGDQVVPQSIFDSCMLLDCASVWKWRAMRAYALNLVIEQQRRNPHMLRNHQHAALLLTAAVPWLLNSLHPSTCDFWREGYRFLPLSVDKGAIFLQDIRFPHKAKGEDVPFFKGFSSSNRIEEDALVPLLGSGVQATIVSFVRSGGSVPLFPIPPPSPNGPRHFHATLINFGRIRRSPFFLRSAIDDPDLAALNGGPNPMEDHSLLAELVEFIVAKHFFANLLHFCPSGVRLPLSAPAEAVESAEAQDKIIKHREIFQRNDLGAIFKHVHWKHASDSEWRRAFGRLFPRHSAIHAKKHSPFQHYHYFQLWLELAKWLSAYSFSILRCMVWNAFFKDLTWIPYCSKRRIWARAMTAGFHGFPTAAFPDNADIYILVNSPDGPVLNVPDV